MKSRVYFCLIFSLLIQTVLISQTDVVYGLNFTTGKLRLASMDVNMGNYQLVSPIVLSPDGFQPGVADFDPINKRFLYTRVNQFFLVDAFSGQVISSPNMTAPPPASGNNTVIPITNIAYNWLDDEVYGLNHQFKQNSNSPFGGNEELRLCKVSIMSGDVTLISNLPTSTSPYLTANSDIDPINRRYFYATPDEIITVDLDSGENIYSKSINYPTSPNQQTFVNLTYDWQNDIIYGLNFENIPNSNPSTFTSTLKLATIDPATGNVNIVSDQVISNDGFSMGDCDIDPTNNRYFYVRQDSLFTVNLTDGSLINKSKIENINNAIVPLTSIVYDDLTEAPLGVINKNMGETVEILPGESIFLNAWVGNDISYEWQDGSTDPTLLVTESGEYQVTIKRNGFTIVGTITVEEGTVVSTGDLEEELVVNIFPNPAQDVIHFELESFDGVQNELELMDIHGKSFLSKNVTSSVGNIDVSNLATGIYILRFYQDGKVTQRKIVIE